MNGQCRCHMDLLAYILFSVVHHQAVWAGARTLGLWQQQTVFSSQWLCCVQVVLRQRILQGTESPKPHAAHGEGLCLRCRTGQFDISTFMTFRKEGPGTPDSTSLVRQSLPGGVKGSEFRNKMSS